MKTLEPIDLIRCAWMAYYKLERVEAYLNQQYGGSQRELAIRDFTRAVQQGIDLADCIILLADTRKEIVGGMEYILNLDVAVMRERMEEANRD